MRQSANSKLQTATLLPENSAGRHIEVAGENLGAGVLAAQAGVGDVTEGGRKAPVIVEPIAGFQRGAELDDRAQALAIAVVIQAGDQIG